MSRFYDDSYKVEKSRGLDFTQGDVTLLISRSSRCAAHSGICPVTETMH